MSILGLGRGRGLVEVCSLLRDPSRLSWNVFVNANASPPFFFSAWNNYLAANSPMIKYIY